MMEVMRLATNIFKKVLDTTNTTITKIGVKTSSSIEKSKLKMHIDALNKQVDDLLKQIGEDVFSLWVDEADISRVDKVKFEEIRCKKAEIEQMSIQLEQISKRDDEILGKKSENDISDASNEKVICPNCNIEYGKTARFCGKCGFELKG